MSREQDPKLDVKDDSGATVAGDAGSVDSASADPEVNKIERQASLPLPMESQPTPPLLPEEQDSFEHLPAEPGLADLGQASFRLISAEDFTKLSSKIEPSQNRTSDDPEPSSGGLKKADFRWRLGARAVDTAIFALLAGWTIPVLGPLLGLAYLLLADGVKDGASVGKRIFGLQVKRITAGRNNDERSTDTQDASLFDSLLRNAPFGLVGLFSLIPIIGWALFLTLGLAVIGFETYMIWSDPRGVRAGDILAGTRVQDTGQNLLLNHQKNTEAAELAKNDLHNKPVASAAEKTSSGSAD